MARSGRLWANRRPCNSGISTSSTNIAWSLSLMFLLLFGYCGNCSLKNSKHSRAWLALILPKISGGMHFPQGQNWQLEISSGRFMYAYSTVQNCFIWENTGTIHYYLANVLPYHKCKYPRFLNQRFVICTAWKKSLKCACDISEKWCLSSTPTSWQDLHKDGYCNITKLKIWYVFVVFIMS